MFHGWNPFSIIRRGQTFQQNEVFAPYSTFARETELFGLLGGVLFLVNVRRNLNIQQE